MEQMTEDQIEENVRYCEELLRNNPDFIPNDEPDWWGETPAEHAPGPENRPPVIPPEQTVRPEPALHFEPVKSPAPSDAVTQIPLTSGIQRPEETVAESRIGGVFKLLRSFLICAAIALAVGILITKFIANHTMVEGSSMEPALRDGDNLIVEKVSYLFGDPARFDIIVFKQSQNINYIKRIIGLPGERVRIEEGKIYINDNPIFDSYGDGSLTDGGLAENTVTLGNDEYFVLGDNRDGSEDSRNKNVGSVRKSQILGKAWFRVTPFEQFGFLD